MVRAMRGKLAPVIGIRRKKDEQANKDIRIQNQAVLVGFRSAYAAGICASSTSHKQKDDEESS
jgi:hypothetical protein